MITNHYQSKIEIGLYRIAKEALTNAMNHAQAESVIIKLVYEEDKIILIVKDDGKGFDLAKIPSNRFGVNKYERTGEIIEWKIRN